MRRPAALAVASLVAALGVVGCGGGRGDDDERRIRAIVEEIAGDPSAVCDHLGEAAAERLGGADGCRQLAGPGTSGAPAGEVEVEDVEIDGDAATAAIRTADGAEELRLVREGGDWTVALAE